MPAYMSKQVYKIKVDNDLHACTSQDKALTFAPCMYDTN
jgi:hypothetical protein